MRIAAGTEPRLTGTVMCKYPEDDSTGVPHRGGLSSVEQLAPAVPLIRVVGELTGEVAVRLRRTAHAQLTRSPQLLVVDLRLSPRCLRTG